MIFFFNWENTLIKVKLVTVADMRLNHEQTPCCDVTRSKSALTDGAINALIGFKGGDWSCSCRVKKMRMSSDPFSISHYARVVLKKFPRHLIIIIPSFWLARAAVFSEMSHTQELFGQHCSGNIFKQGDNKNALYAKGTVTLATHEKFSTLCHSLSAEK